MIDILSVIALGFALGIRHATDADHVIAVTTIVSRERSLRLAAWIGALWGVGHTLTIALIGGAIIFGGWVIPDRLGLAMEFAVAFMLILLGIPAALSGIRGQLRQSTASAEPSSAPADHLPPDHAHAHAVTMHTHPHPHGDYVHTHAHGHAPESHPHAPDATPLARLDRRFGRLGVYQFVRPLVVGIVHGLAGSAAVALLVLATIRDPRWAMAYLLVFGLGTIVGMVTITMAIAVPFAVTNQRFAMTNHRLRVAAGVLSIGFGLFLAWRVVSMS